MIPYMFLFADDRFDLDHHIQPGTLLNFTEYFSPAIMAVFMLLSDMVCIAKSRFIMGKAVHVSRYSEIVLYFIIDTAATFAIVEIFLCLAHLFILIIEAVCFGGSAIVHHFNLLLGAIFDDIPRMAPDFIRQSFAYFTPNELAPDAVLLPSGLFTSAWFALTALSILVGRATYLITPFRDFMVFYFKDLEAKPIFVLAKFSGSLLLVIAFLLLAMHLFIQ